MRTDLIELQEDEYLYLLNDRKFLQKLRQAAEKHMDWNFNLYWKLAYSDLVKALDRLDAMIARINYDNEQADSIKDADENETS